MDAPQPDPLFSDDRASPIRVFPSRADFADVTAEALIARHAAQRPDFSALTLLVPNAGLARQLRLCLTAHAGGAMLGPSILTLRALAQRGGVAAVAPLRCRLRLREALLRYRGLFPGQDFRRVADALFGLFEELSLDAVTLPEDEQAFADELRKAYRAPLLTALSREAQIVHRLWLAYREDIGTHAPAAAYLQGLRAAFAAMPMQTPIYWLGFDSLRQGERALLLELLEAGRAQFWTQGRLQGRDGEALLQWLGGIHPAREIDSAVTARSALLDAVFDFDDIPADPTPMIERATALRPQLGDDADRGLRLVRAADAEHEARCVDLIVREAILGGARRICIVSGDRRLARRLRALLERAGVVLVDRVGWALSTSRAAAAVDAFLGCVESDFHYRPLFDLLRCGFIREFVDDRANHAERPGQTDEAMQASAFAALADRLAARDVYATRANAPALYQGLSAWQRTARAERDAEAQNLFERMARAAAHLPLRGEARAGTDWLNGLQKALSVSGLVDGLQTDIAGKRLLETLAELGAAMTELEQPLGWSEFRRVLDAQLEETLFQPELYADPGSGEVEVELRTLDQCHGLRSDCVILAAANAAQLPGAPPGEPFFNAAVRSELGLESWSQRRARSLARLRGLLESAPQVWLTASAATVGEPAEFSPWIEALACFARAAGLELEDRGLAARAGTADTDIAAASPSISPAQRAAPPADPSLIDFDLSAGAHQSLLDCPYQFHAREALGWFAPQPPDAPADRSDFGDRVHQILRAFYQTVAGLPAPYAGDVNRAQQPAIEQKLLTLGDAGFAPDLAARPLAGAWLREFRALVPWLARQIADRGDAQIHVELSQPATRAGWRLKGAVDRLETHPDGMVVVDYKTGTKVPGKGALEDGEKVQLAHYALMLGAQRGVEYWDLKKQRVTALDAAELKPLLAAVEERLQNLSDAIRARHPLPASGAPEACRHCDYAGLCRHDAVPPTSAPI